MRGVGEGFGGVRFLRNATPAATGLCLKDFLEKWGNGAEEGTQSFSLSPLSLLHSPTPAVTGPAP